MADASGAGVRMPAGYEFVRTIGSGGNGVVVCARQVSLDRLVAVKSITDGACDRVALARLQREGAALARLRHPNIVSVIDVITVGENLVLVMEYVDGPDLAAWLDSADVDDPAILPILSDVADGIEHAGAQGVVHRDLKPANILLTAQLQARITDFGLARLSANSATFRTERGVVSGTPRYMSPEHIVDPDSESPAMDAYSFAVIAYRMLTGGYPFAAESPEALVAANVTMAPREPRELNPRLPDRAAAALLGGLDKDPALRLGPSAVVAELRAALPDAIDGRAQSRPSVTAAPAREPATDLPWVDPVAFRPARPSLFTRLLPVLIGAGIGLFVMLVIVLVTR